MGGETPTKREPNKGSQTHCRLAPRCFGSEKEQQDGLPTVHCTVVQTGGRRQNNKVHGCPTSRGEGGRLKQQPLASAGAYDSSVDPKQHQGDRRTTQRDLTTSGVCSRIWQVHLAGARRQVDELGGKHVIKET